MIKRRKGCVMAGEGQTNDKQEGRGEERGEVEKERRELERNIGERR